MIKVPFGNLARQYKNYKSEIENSINSVLKSGYFILGENVKKFEIEFSAYCGSKYGIGVGSGTEALHIALIACGVKHGDEVITVANTAIPTVSAISSTGATPVFIDIEEDSYNINVDLIEEKITKKTKVILPVHLYGNPCKMDKIITLANKYKLRVIEDCAQAHGSEYKGKKVGTFGDLGCFSFYPSKNLGAYGDGGMIISDNMELSDEVRLLRNYGQEKRYFNIIKGFNSRLDEIQASILRFKLGKLDEWNDQRIALAKKYTDSFRDFTIIPPRVFPGNKHVFHLYVIRIKNRDKFIEFLENNGINILIHYPIPIHLQPAYKELQSNNNLPITEKVSKEIVSLPIYPELEKNEVDCVIDKIREFYRSQ